MRHCHRINLYAASTAILLLLEPSQAFKSYCHPTRIRAHYLPSRSNNRITSHKSRPPSILSAADASLPSTESSPQPIMTKQQKRLAQIKSEGGPLSFNTKYGALNPYAIYYGVTSIALGIVWFIALSVMQIVYKLSGDRFDKKRRIPVFLSQCWGTALLGLTGCFPRIENWGVIREFHKRCVFLFVVLFLDGMILCVLNT